jgi:hypothetical protein
MTVLNAPRVDTIILDETILDDVPGCISQHRNTTCSVDIAYIIRSCTTLGPTCAAHVEDVNFGMLAKFAAGMTCGGCRRPARECWSWWPA